MNLRTPSLNGPRRIFLAVVVVLALVLGWELIDRWRTGIQEHRIGTLSKIGIFIRTPPAIQLPPTTLRWNYLRDGAGELQLTYSSTAQWDFAPYAGKDLRAVRPEDARVEFYGAGSSGQHAFGPSWRTNELLVHDGQIILVRPGVDRQTVYALQVVEQSDGAGRFRSRKILPAPR